MARAEATAIVKDALERAWQRTATTLAWTRALVSAPVPPRRMKHEEGTFVWNVRPADSHVLGTFYTDGSVVDAELGKLATVSWAFAVLDDQGACVAAASGLTPWWITDINGGEAWAILAAARHAVPGSTFITDSQNCVRAMARGPRWTTSPRCKLARVWRLIFSVFDDDVDTALLTWMPAHTTRGAIGNVVKGDGTNITELDWDGNRRADQLAKSTALANRAPLWYRAERLAMHDVLHRVARHLGWATWAANKCPMPLSRDAQALTTAERKAARGAATRSGTTTRRTIKFARPVELGGHDLRGGEAGWRCTVCRTVARRRDDIASLRCPGLAVQKWADMEEASRLGGGVAVANGRRHHRWMSGDLIWCSLCGAYGELKAVGLAAACPGPPPNTGSGRTTSLSRLRAGRHPKSNLPLHGPPTPEPSLVRHGRLGDVLTRLWGRMGRQHLRQLRSLRPLSSPRRRPPPRPLLRRRGDWTRPMKR